MHYRANQCNNTRNFEDINSCYDLDSISQISALDSASQTGMCTIGRHTGGGSGITDYGMNPNYSIGVSDKIGNRSNMVKQFSSDSNIHRSYVANQKNHHSQKPIPPDTFGMNCNVSSEGDSTTSIKRGQFPYAYIRSRLAVLPEEQAGQISRRESMNKQSDQMMASASLQGCVVNSTSGEHITNDQKYGSTRSECGAQTDHADNRSYSKIKEEALEDSSCQISKYSTGYTSLRARKVALRRKRSLSVADIPVINSNSSETGEQENSLSQSKLTENNRQKPHIKSSNSIKYEESGYDSDTTRKSSPRGSLKHGSTSGSGSASISESNSSGGHNSCEESNSSTKELSSDDTNSSNGGEDCNDEETRRIRGEDETLIPSGSEDSGAVFKKSIKHATDNYNKKIERHVSSKSINLVTPSQANRSKVASNKMMNSSRTNTANGQFSLSGHGISSSGNTIKKPPRKSKLPEPVNPSSTLKKISSNHLNTAAQANTNFANETSMTQSGFGQQMRKFKKNGEPNATECSSGDELGDNDRMPAQIKKVSSNAISTGQKYLSSSTVDQNHPNSNLSSKRFKMLRLKKDGNGCEGELGIVISKKSHSQKGGASGYIVAHIEPEGLVER